MKLGLYLTICKNQLRSEVVRILAGNTEKTLTDIGQGNNVFCCDIKSKGNRSKTDKRDYIELRSFCSAMETIIKMKRQPIDWENIFINYIFDKQLISKTYKEPIQSP